MNTLIYFFLEFMYNQLIHFMRENLESYITIKTKDNILYRVAIKELAKLFSSDILRRKCFEEFDKENQYKWSHLNVHSNDMKLIPNKMIDNNNTEQKRILCEHNRSNRIN